MSFDRETPPQGAYGSIGEILYSAEEAELLTRMFRVWMRINEVRDRDDTEVDQAMQVLDHPDWREVTEAAVAAASLMRRNDASHAQT